MQRQEYIDRFNAFHREGRIIRKKWTQEREGREYACLLAALSPEVAYSKDEKSCPADLMPVWLAYLTPWIDDAGSDAKWPEHVRRYSALVPHFHKLGQRAEYRVRRACVVEAKRHTDKPEILSVCDRVISLCDRAIAGDMPMSNEWEAAAWAARAAAAWAAAAAAAEAASDRLIDDILTILEDECGQD